MNHPQFSTMTMSQLKVYCRNHNITNYSRYTRKYELINFIVEQIANQSDNTSSYSDSSVNISNLSVSDIIDLSSDIMNSTQNNIATNYEEQLTNQMLFSEYDEELKKAIEESKKEQQNCVDKRKSERDIQDQEYKQALEQDLLQNEQESQDIINNTNDIQIDNDLENTLDYQKNITKEELDKIRMARLSRFS